ncbi:MAG TPA: GNAT family protein [Nitrososphaerales archaeon]|nr:GNAT family protein [Nitrososphaerales archaeon]
MSIKKLGPCVLDGMEVRLEPLRQEHASALLTAAKQLDWNWFLRPLRTKEDIDERIAHGLRTEKEDKGYAFIVKTKRDEQVVGSTSYLMIDSEQGTTEIGSTWYTPACQGTKVNPECKYLLMKHAFEDWGAIRVQFITDVNNIHSQRAILKIGAKFEGKLRNHKIRVDGSIRDSMVYSVIRSEWPTVREGLLARIRGK